MSSCLCPLFRFPATRAKQYKLGVEILSCLVILAQLVRIAVIGYEIKNIAHEFTRKNFSKEHDPCDYKLIYVLFPKSTAILFAMTSILLGTLCSFVLEPLLLWSVKKRHLEGIQPWFMSTLLIFLIALLACVVTSSIYVIKPIDHNINTRPYSHSNISIVNFCQNGHIDADAPLPKNHTGQVSDRSFQISTSTNMSLKVVEEKGFISCIRLSSTSTRLNSSAPGQTVVGRNDTVEEYRKEEWLLTGDQRGGHDLSPCDPEPGHQKPVYYEPSPVLAMSFLIDIIRCLPQLFLVNRFVKAEKLHVVHMTPHSSLSALYVKRPSTA